ncbi:hypothetical protein C2S51_009618 [Perilla frutescens var. frutescens]|nr:hypothetical protein C2S51_009618 [Perilla frutescens var. frutescens]
MIRATLLKIGGDDAVRLFISGYFGYFLDYRGGDVQKRVIHALMTYEVHASDRARVGREAWFHIHHSQLRFGPSEYALVSGLRFGGSTFDPNDDHIVPSRSVYYRLFEGKRTTVKQMDDRSEPGRGSMGVGASGGCGAMELISIGCIFLPDVDALHRPRPQDSTGYGRERIWTVWAYEVIPELANEAGVHSGQLTVPRCLRWTFRLRATDPATLLQRASRVVMLVPSPEETGTSYYLSLQLEPGAQSVRFVPARSGNKKKMLANVASCCSTLAEEVVPPSARGTRAARTPQKGRQVIVVCDVSGEHWVVVHIRFSDWVVELYDSLLFQMDDPSDRVEYERRDRELMPLLRLLPRLLICAGFWEGHPMPLRCAFAMTLDKSIPD